MPESPKTLALKHLKVAEMATLSAFRILEDTDYPNMWLVEQHLKNIKHIESNIKRIKKISYRF